MNTIARIRPPWFSRLLVLYAVLMLSPALVLAQMPTATAMVLPSPTPIPSPTPLPSPSPTPPEEWCTNALASLTPSDISSFQFNPGDNIPIMDPTQDFSDHSEYDITAQFAPTDLVGVVLPNFDNYAIDPLPSTTFQSFYDVSGCWGQYGAKIFAQTGLYSFLAGARGILARIAAALVPKTAVLCTNRPPAVGVAAPTRYDPLGATNFPATGETGFVIDDSLDPAILLAQQVLDSKGIKYKKIGGGAATAVADMNKAIDDTYIRNNRNPITAVEVGHGAPNRWVNVTSDFNFAGGNPSNDLLLLEAGSLSKIATFDIFSCWVAEGNTNAGAPNANHVQTHLARNTVNARGTAVNTRAVNVPIWIIGPRAPRGANSFEVKNTGANGKGTTVTVTCSGTPVTCTSTTTNIYP